MIEVSARALSDHAAVSAARAAVRKLLNDGTIVLKPNTAHTSLEGAVRFAELGEQVLGLSGTHRNVKALGGIAPPTRPKVQANQEKGILVAGA